jgi:hypothetical protein
VKQRSGCGWSWANLGRRKARLSAWLLLGVMQAACVEVGHEAQTGCLVDMDQPGCGEPARDSGRDVNSGSGGADGAGGDAASVDTGDGAGADAGTIDATDEPEPDGSSSGDAEAGAD